MKKRIAKIICAAVLVALTFSGTTMLSSAANTVDKPFSFDNRNTSTTSSWREKQDYSKVYVYPKAGPKIYYTVQGKTGEYGSVANRSNIVAIPQGVQGSITNQVKESGNDYARLKFKRITTAYVITSGVWSPDSSRTFTVFN